MVVASRSSFLLHSLASVAWPTALDRFGESRTERMAISLRDWRVATRLGESGTSTDWACPISVAAPQVRLSARPEQNLPVRPCGEHPSSYGLGIPAGRAGRTVTGIPPWSGRSRASASTRWSCWVRLRNRLAVFILPRSKLENWFNERRNPRAQYWLSPFGTH